MGNFNPRRLVIARKRRRLTAKALADKIGVSPVTISRLENGSNPPEEHTLRLISEALGFPSAFFFQDDLDEMRSEAASFRSLTSMSAKERDSALASGAFAFLFSDWVCGRFNLPASGLIDLSAHTDPENAAYILRQEWGLGQQPIPNMIKLLESKGVRVFSLAENTRTVDAFSCWRDDTPYVFLNTFKSAEHSRFDAAHELGHLVLHKHGGPGQARECDTEVEPDGSVFAVNDDREAEREANRFASAFLMPADDVVSRVRGITSVDQLVTAKSRWGVSVAALAYRLHKLRKLTDWQYRTFCIQMNQRGYRTQEPAGIEHEKSIVWQKVLGSLWSEKASRDHVADELHIPVEELDNLLFGLTGNNTARNDTVSSGSLRLVT